MQGPHNRSREIVGEASAGIGACQHLSGKRNFRLGADAVRVAKGNMPECANASARTTHLRLPSKPERPVPHRTCFGGEECVDVARS